MATVNQVWPLRTDCKVTLSGLKDDAGNYVEDATVVGTLKDDGGTNVANAISLQFTHQGANGIYYVIIPYTADLQDGRTYTFYITATSGSRQAVLKMARPAAYITI